MRKKHREGQEKQQLLRDSLRSREALDSLNLVEVTQSRRPRARRIAPIRVTEMADSVPTREGILRVLSRGHNAWAEEGG